MKLSDKLESSSFKKRKYRSNSLYNYDCTTPELFKMRSTVLVFWKKRELFWPYLIELTLINHFNWGWMKSRYVYIPNYNKHFGHFFMNIKPDCMCVTVFWIIYFKKFLNSSPTLPGKQANNVTTISPFLFL